MGLKALVFWLCEMTAPHQLLHDEGEQGADRDGKCVAGMKWYKKDVILNVRSSCHAL